MEPLSTRSLKGTRGTGVWGKSWGRLLLVEGEAFGAGFDTPARASRRASVTGGGKFSLSPSWSFCPCIETLI